jgi:hypothetical protein
VPNSGSTCVGSPSFVGTYFTNAPVLTPPKTNVQLSNIAQNDGTPPGYWYQGQTTIALSGTNATITNNGTTVTRPLPPDGVIYVANGACSASYSPFTATYPASSTCGNVYVHGTYTGQVTIAAENDIIIDGNICRSSCTSPSGNGMLGLIANNFVRIYHPFSAETSKGNCNSGSNGSGSLSNPHIDAAILAINHSFIVDHYDCGSSLGTLTVNGAISQKFRGAVGTFSGGSVVTGYSKNYNYDDRLRYLEPPHFLDPVQVAWHIQRETLDYP